MAPGTAVVWQSRRRPWTCRQVEYRRFQSYESITDERLSRPTAEAIETVSWHGRILREPGPYAYCANGLAAMRNTHKYRLGPV